MCHLYKYCLLINIYSKKNLVSTKYSVYIVIFINNIYIYIHSLLRHCN